MEKHNYKDEDRGGNQERKDNRNSSAPKGKSNAGSGNDSRNPNRDDHSSSEGRYGNERKSPRDSYGRDNRNARDGRNSGDSRNSGYNRDNRRNDNPGENRSSRSDNRYTEGREYGRPYGSNQPDSRDNSYRKPFGRDNDSRDKPYGRGNSDSRQDSGNKPYGRGNSDSRQDSGNKPYGRTGSDDRRGKYGDDNDRFNKDRRDSFGRDNRGSYNKDRRESNTYNQPRDRYPDKREDNYSGNRFEDDRERRKRITTPGKSYSGDGRPYGKTDLKNRRGKRQRIPSITARTSFGPDGTMRLNKFIAHSGICSRREADDLISAGLVTVNDEVITELGSRVKRGDSVKYNGERIRSEKKVYILLNKPKDFVTTNDDPEGRKTVLDLVKSAGNERVYPVGRLDRNTTGVLLLTNDGEMASKLTHPKYNRKKIYHVFLDKPLLEEDYEKVAKGLELEDGFIKPDAVDFVKPDSKSELGIEIHSGKNRVVRRIFETLGYHVARLDRVYFAGLTKKNLSRGKWRFLTEKEISMLKMSAFE